MELVFLGGAGTVTGSRTLVEHDGHRLLVDCGLFQGLKQLRLRNWAPFPVPAASIDAVVLTHAHIDHSGWLPRLVEAGFRGAVHATAATAELCALLWPDSGRLQEEEAAFANRHGTSKHHPALALYTEAQARQALTALRAHAFSTTFEPLPGLEVAFTRAGHILGAAGVHVRGGGRSVLFSGDVGRDDDLVMRPPEPPPVADGVVLESTYGDRLHPTGDVLAPLADIVCRTAARGGVVVVPAFAVGRAQSLLHALARLKAARRIPGLPVYLNSPMASDVTSVLLRHADEHRLTPSDCRALARDVRIVNTEEESRALNALVVPSVIISASGMATGGRVVHHLKAYAPDARHAIVFAGYQAMGTRGAALVGGAKEIRIHGGWIPVRAEVVRLDGFSAHADREGLLRWIGALPQAPRQVWLNHGEPVAADVLRQAIEERHGWACTVAEPFERYTLDGAGSQSQPSAPRG
ncbi:MAG TPA: MBL fold metallo-hydrolase [Caldimonas sp.]|nr:MBL fold metallo-hydrolase [Caldimonas sp.]